MARDRQAIRAEISDIVPEVEYQKYKDPDHYAEGYGVKSNRTVFRKGEVRRILDFIRDGLQIDVRVHGDTKAALLTAVRAALDDHDYRGVDISRFGKRFTKSELFGVLDAVEDAQESLRWQAGESDE